jgi:alpha-tubulin suppressor-like RCC1 family protein
MKAKRIVGLLAITLLIGQGVPQSASAAVTEVDAGAAFTCAVTDSGNVKCWGLNNSGNLGNDTTLHSFSPVNVLDPDDPSGLLTGATGITAGGTNENEQHACSVHQDGVAKCWGRGTDGQLGNGTFSSSYTPVSVVPYPLCQDSCRPFGLGF